MINPEERFPPFELELEVELLNVCCTLLTGLVSGIFSSDFVLTDELEANTLSLAGIHS